MDCTGAAKLREKEGIAGLGSGGKAEEGRAGKGEHE